MHILTVFLRVLSVISICLAFTINDVFESLKEVPQGWTRLRSPTPDSRIQFRIALEQPNKKLFEQTLMDVSTPDHPRYGQHLTRLELKSILMPAEKSTKAVLTWLETSGIPKSDIEDDGEWINFVASISKAEEMFLTKFYVYIHNIDKVETIRTLQYSVPREVFGHITMVQPTTRFSRMIAERGNPFETFPSAEKVDHHKKVPKYPSTTLNVTACNVTITPDCLRDLYSVGDYQADPTCGSLFGVCGYLKQYAKYKQLEVFLEEYAPYAAGANFSYALINGGLATQDDVADDEEANLDIQYAAAMSYRTPITYYSTGGLGSLIPDLDQPDPSATQNEPYLDFLHYMMRLPDDKLPQTITTSYGEDEQSVPAAYSRTVCNMFGQLGARGVSVIFSSGDTGVGSACQTNDGHNTTRFLPIFPAACPFVTSVGATRYVNPEFAVSFSSGGFSDRFPRPSYQDDAIKSYLGILGGRWKGLYNPAGRGFPDVAAQGVRFHVIERNKDSLISGTSASSPAFAAIVSLLNNARLSAGRRPLGFLNPWIYSVGKNGLTDIVNGGSRGCTGRDIYSNLSTPFVPYASWNATKGWDPVTGWGTPNFQKLLELSTPGYAWRSMKNKDGKRSTLL